MPTVTVLEAETSTFLMLASVMKLVATEPDTDTVMSLPLALTFTLPTVPSEDGG
jgi:hypothetical protein